MNVLVASHLYPSARSRTAGSFVHNQVRFLSAHARMRVVSPTPWFPLPGLGPWSTYRRLPRQEVMDGIEVQRPRYLTLPRRLLLGLAWRSYLAALDRSGGWLPDLVHAHCAYPDGLAAVAWGRRQGRPVVVTVHGHDIKDLPRHAGWRRLVVEALEGAAMVVAVSQDLAARVRDLGMDPAKLRVIPNGVDCEVFRPGTGRQPGRGGWRLLYVGRFDPAKGIGVLLEALARLRQQGWDVSLSLVGGNPATGTGDRFRGQVGELGLSGCVDFVDEVPWTELPQRMAQVDVFVLPSFSEGLPLVLVEAMACGLPIVATRCGGPEELVEEGVGRLAPVEDVEGLQAALAEVLGNYPRYDRASIRRRAEEQYDYRGIAARLHQVYEDVLSRAVHP